MVPNDVIKRPGPHHAYRVDLEKLAELRAAVAPLEELGVAEPLAELLGVPVQWVLDRELLLSDLPARCFVGEDFGLALYGPMLSLAGLPVTFGAPLIPERDARVDPISSFWADHRPCWPQRLAPAVEILESVAVLRDPPTSAWDRLLGELRWRVGDDEPGYEVPADRRPRALVARWRTEYVHEVDAFCERLRVIAAGGGSVTTWLSHEGWL